MSCTSATAGTDFLELYVVQSTVVPEFQDNSMNDAIIVVISFSETSITVPRK
jgi:hypothetical protein